MKTRISKSKQNLGERKSNQLRRQQLRTEKEKRLKENELEVAEEKSVRTDRERAFKRVERARFWGAQTAACANGVLSFV